MACSRSRARLPLTAAALTGRGMCKHVAAVLYGVGSRLDSQPELLFLLRDVDAQELIAAEMALPDAAVGAAGDTLADDQLGAIFGIDLDTEAEAPHAPQTQRKKQPRATRRIAATKARQPAHAAPGRKTAPAATPAGRSPQAARTGTRREPSPPPATTTMRAAAKVATSTPSKDSPYRQIGSPTAPTAGTVCCPICRPTWCCTCDCVPMGNQPGPAQPASPTTERPGGVATAGQERSEVKFPRGRGMWSSGGLCGPCAGSGDRRRGVDQRCP